MRNVVDHASAESFQFIPLLGAETFGCNLNVYVCDGKILIVDCGLGFENEDLCFSESPSGVPLPAFLKKNRNRVQGLVLTHGHMDHIGAVWALLPQLRCPLYTTSFTADLLSARSGGEDFPFHLVRRISPLVDMDIGNFSIRLIPVPHSIPSAHALAITTRYGRVLHSGDWKYDLGPVLGEPINPSYFKHEGDKGVLAYIGDSTNAEKEGFSGSEGEVSHGLLKEFQDCSGKIVVATFSSHVGRMISIARAAESCGRSVFLAGRSLKNIADIAAAHGFLDDLSRFITRNDLLWIMDQKILMIVTGSQGEPGSVLARIASGSHPFIRLEEKDTVLFSSRVIPGSEEHVAKVIADLHSLGVRVVTPADTNNVIYVSGHPCREEIRRMYEWLRPRIVIPVHGERRQLEAQADFARASGVPEVIVPCDGAVIHLAPGAPGIVANAGSRVGGNVVAPEDYGVPTHPAASL